MSTKYGAARACAKGKQRSSKKRIGTRGASFKDAPRPRSKPMVKRFVEPVAVAPVQSMDTGADTLSEFSAPVRKYAHKQDIGKVFPTTDRTPVIERVKE